MRHKFEGIGEASAAVIVATLSANPSTVFLATGIPGKLVFFVAKIFSMWLASAGLVLLNVGAARLSVIADKNNFDDSWNDAEKLIAEIRSAGRELSDDEIQKIDGPVIDAFRKFASLGRMHKRRRDT